MIRERFNNLFRLHHEREDSEAIVENITRGVAFQGTNLWILIFAILLASLGLNVNSTAVIIGAMLISPLMGPIMGLGLGLGINDLSLLRQSLYSYIVSSGIGLAASAFYFLLSPLSEAHSELLARISPTIYDVLIALLGGLAGILAISSKQKGNVLPGVAIATALMPPLCTAGYGIATHQLAFFLGALYLFVINTVFIALATFITVRILKLPYKHLLDRKAEIRSKRIVFGLVLLTIAPSIYFGYDMIVQNNFNKSTGRFIDSEASIPNDYLLKKVVDSKKRHILLIFGGKEISETQVNHLKAKLHTYGLDNTTLEIKQGFAYLKDDKESGMQNQLNEALSLKERELLKLKQKVDSLQSINQFNIQLKNEAKAINPAITFLSMGPLRPVKNGNSRDSITLVYLQFSKIPDRKEKLLLENWLQIKLNKKIKLVLERD
jgi:uncharacterized hydrophobic protein (TIGR00271 family)